VCNNPKGPYIYLLMGLNDYLDLLVKMEGATSISTISLVDMEVESFRPYIYVPIPWAKHTKTIVRGASSLRNLSCSKLEFSPFLSRAAARNFLHPSPKFCIYSFRRMFGELFRPPRTSPANSASTPRFVSSFSTPARFLFHESMTV
jgi:hypothetical protein